MSNPPGRSQPPRPPRVLACVHCQHRKVKCDRKFPCANCVKHDTQCVPATQARRRRRRFPERELLDRLRRYEDLLRQADVKFEPLHKDPALEEKESPEGCDESDDEQLLAQASDPPSVPPSVKSENVFETKSIWQALSLEDQRPENSSNPPLASELETTVKGALEQLADDDHILFGSRSITVELYTFHPEPIHIFRLWQIYLDNVDPLFKVTHTPSLQLRIVEAAAKLRSVSPALEALLFGMYSIAIRCLPADDCQAIFGLSQEDLLVKYQFGCQQALMNAKYLRTSDRDCLTALFLYMLSIQSGSDPRPLSCMLGVAVRIAKRMGMHNEASLTKNSVFEAEMRRRLWWSLVIFDHRMGEKADIKDSSLAPTWDCKVPLNVNDSDLRPEMKEPPVGQETTTEAVFVVVRNEVADFVRHSSFHLDFFAPPLKLIAKELPSGGDLVSFQKRIEEKFKKICDAENPIHFVTIWTTRAYLAKCHLMVYYSTLSDPAVHQSEAQRDHAMSLAFTILECDTKFLNSALVKGYRWHLYSYFPFPAYMHILQHLRRRPFSKQAGPAWEVLSRSYEARFPALDAAPNPLLVMFDRLVLLAWSTVVKASKSAEPLDPPRIVSLIRQRDVKVMQNVPNIDAMESNIDFNLDFDNLFPSVPMGLGDDSLLFGIGGQGTLGIGAFGFPSTAGQNPLILGAMQPGWPPMDWDLG